MINKLKKLGYKRIEEFNPQFQDHFKKLLNGRPNPFNSTYYMKMIDITLAYDMEDGSKFENTVSLSIFFMVNEPNNDVDNYYCVCSYPFEIKTEADFDGLQKLFEVYRNDVKTVMSDILKQNQTEA